jgi:putative Mg2+ transporter-C (MgtC) family protein
LNSLKYYAFYPGVFLDMPNTQLSFEADFLLLLRLLVAALLCGLLGWERETRGKPAGLRTHMLVGVSAALFVSLGELMIVRYREEGMLMRLNMIDILGAVVSGVSFLGAGMIFVSRGKDVQGLTTAASILATSAVGVTAGLEHYVLAAGVTILLLFILRVVGWLDVPKKKSLED